jgi:octopine/nopaline transport system permease protein
MNFELIISSFPKMLGAALITVKLLAFSLAIGLLIGLFFAVLRLNKNIFINRFAYGYSYLFRGTPLLVQIYIIYFGLGQIEFIRSTFLWVILKEPFWCGVLALTINTVAYGSEIFRGGIQSVTKGQIESGLSLGFNKFMLLRKVILPIALRKVLPSYGNELILMVKATSLVSLTTYMEMTGIARKIMAKTFAPVEAFIAAGILYLFLNFLMVQFVKYLEWKYNPHLRVEQN